MQVAENTPTQSLTVQGYQLKAFAPFHEGYPLKANEAAQMNQVLGENLRNNFAAKIWAKKKEKAGKDATDDVIAAVELDVSALQTEFDEYFKTYEFGLRSGSGRSSDPIEREMRTMAEVKIKELLKKKGYNMTEAKKSGKFVELVEQYTTKNYDALHKQAEKRVKEVSKMVVEDLEI